MSIILIKVVKWDINIVSGVKYQFIVCLLICNYGNIYYNFKEFRILLNFPKIIQQRVHFKIIFVLIRCKDTTSLSEGSVK